CGGHRHPRSPFEVALLEPTHDRQRTERRGARRARDDGLKLREKSEWAGLRPKPTREVRGTRASITASVLAGAERERRMGLSRPGNDPARPAASRREQEGPRGECQSAFPSKVAPVHFASLRRSPWTPSSELDSVHSVTVRPLVGATVLR